MVSSKRTCWVWIFIAIIEREALSFLRWEAGTDDPPTAQFASPVEGPFLFPGTLSFE